MARTANTIRPRQERVHQDLQFAGRVACSNMPRFGANKVLTEKQIKDLVAFLFDPESPVNK